MELVEVKCYNCHSSESQPYDRENGFHLVKCLGCGLLYLNPRPSDEQITKGATTGRHWGVTLMDVTGAYLKKKEAHYRVILAQLFQDKPPQGDWLDIGCGHGEFLAALQGFCGSCLRSKGTEPNVAKVESARRSGLDVDNIDLSRHDVRYDFISLLNVYSHLPEPVGIIGRWKRLLKPGGQLVLETGDTCDLPAWRHPKPYRLPDHLSFASAAIVIGILQRLGFNIVVVSRHRSYPRFTPVYVSRQIAKLLIPNKRANLDWFPSNPNRDLWIRARLED